MAQAAQNHESKSPSCVNAQTVHMLYFCPLEAEVIGLNEAIVIARIRFWLGRSKHLFGGRPWVYNTYPDWQKQFSFWSVFTVKSIFRRLEELGVLESTQRFNTNRWNKTKWYTLNEKVLATMMEHTMSIEAVEVSVAEAAGTEVVSMGAEGVMDGEPPTAIEGIATAPIDGVEFVPSLSGRSPDQNAKRACASEPEAGARSHALETADPVVSSCHHETAREPARATWPQAAVTPKEEGTGWADVDTAFAFIPETERLLWLERAKETLREQGTSWLEACVPVVRSLAFRLWELGMSVDPEAMVTGERLG
jgi:hypothetical protein